jgi:hypothetical protein
MTIRDLQKTVQLLDFERKAVRARFHKPRSLPYLQFFKCVLFLEALHQASYLSGLEAAQEEVLRQKRLLIDGLNGLDDSTELRS